MKTKRILIKLGATVPHPKVEMAFFRVDVEMECECEPDSFAMVEATELSQNVRQVFEKEIAAARKRMLGKK